MSVSDSGALVRLMRKIKFEVAFASVVGKDEKEVKKERKEKGEKGKCEAFVASTRALQYEIDISFVIVSFVTAGMEKDILDKNVFARQK